MSLIDTILPFWWPNLASSSIHQVTKNGLGNFPPTTPSTSSCSPWPFPHRVLYIVPWKGTSHTFHSSKFGLLVFLLTSSTIESAALIFLSASNNIILSIVAFLISFLFYLVCLIWQYFFLLQEVDWNFSYTLLLTTIAIFVMWVFESRKRLVWIHWDGSTTSWEVCKQDWIEVGVEEMAEMVLCKVMTKGVRW